MDALLHQVFSGLATGCIYGSIGLALVMIYQATHHINFAQGEIATFSTFIAWSLLQKGWPYWAVFFATGGGGASAAGDGGGLLSGTATGGGMAASNTGPAAASLAGTGATSFASLKATAGDGFSAADGAAATVG